MQLRTCLAAIISDVPNKVHKLCTYTVFQQNPEPHVYVLDYPLVLLSNVEQYSVVCNRHVNLMDGCAFCMFKIQNTCDLVVNDIILPPKLLDGIVHRRTAISYPINLPVLSKFFDESLLAELTGDKQLDYVLGINLPEMKFFNHNFSSQLAVDQKFKYDLDKVAIMVKNDQHIFGSIAEPIVTGDIFLPDNFFFSVPGIMLITTSVVASLLIFVLFIVCFKLYKALMLIAILSAQVQPAAAYPTILSFTQSTTTTPVPFDVAAYVTSVTESQSTLFGLIVVLMVLFILSKIVKWIVKFFQVSHVLTDFSLMLQISRDHTVMFIEIKQFTGCPLEFHFCVPEKRCQVQVTRDQGRKLIVDWTGFPVIHLITKNKLPLPDATPINWWQYRQVKSIMEGDYQCFPVIRHGNFFSYAPVCDKQCSHVTPRADVHATIARPRTMPQCLHIPPEQFV